MKAIFTLTLTLIVSHLFSQSSEEVAVKASFNKYKQSILNDRGEEASECVDSRTIKYYGEMLDLVKNADSVQVNSLSIIDKIMVFSVRHRATRDEVVSLDGKGLFIYAIKKGMISKNSVSDITIHEAMVDGDFAKSQLVSKGQAVPLYFHFYREGGSWKINLTSLFPMTNGLLRKMVTDSGQEENEYLFSLLEALTGKRPGREIWRKIN